MVVSCCAPGCTNRYEKGSDKHFYRFPKDVSRQKRWCIAMKRMSFADPSKLWTPSEHDRLCGAHFVGGKPSSLPDHPDHVPSIFNFTPSHFCPKKSLERYHRKARRQLHLTPVNEDVAIISSEEMSRDTAACALLDLGNDLPKYQDIGTDPMPDPVTESFIKLQTDHKQLQDEYQRLKAENEELKAEISHSKFTYSNLDNSKIKTYTGIRTMEGFLWVLSLVSVFFRKIGKLSPGDQLLLVLMKLRLNLTNNDLAIRFRVCPTQVSKILNSSIPIIADRLSFLIRWPSKETVLKKMPSSFRKHYRKCRVIIDCSEIFIQRSSNLDARSKTWSNYKHYNTLKFLVGITPYGKISFLSKTYGGRISDKEITEKSGFYDKLEYGDLVLADRGFLIAEDLACHGASLAIPPFSRGKKQFSAKEVEMARRLSRERIHVERAIERIKNFHILKQVLPISLLKHSDDILEICASLTNL